MTTNSSKLFWYASVFITFLTSACPHVTHVIWYYDISHVLHGTVVTWTFPTCPIVWWLLSLTEVYQPPPATTSCHVHIASLVSGLSQSLHLELGTGCRLNWKRQPLPLTVSNVPSKHFYFSLPTAVKHVLTVLTDFCNAPSVKM